MLSRTSMSRRAAATRMFAQGNKPLKYSSRKVFFIIIEVIALAHTIN